MKRPACESWDGNKCSLGLFGGKPSAGVCGRCDQYTGPDRGLGDTVHRFAESPGVAIVAALFRAVTFGECGCCGRRRKLNEKFPAAGGGDDGGAAQSEE